MDGILDEQAREDLLALYKETIDEGHKVYFWSVLECVGCAEEFRAYLDEVEGE